VFVFGLPGKSPVAGAPQASASPDKGRDQMMKKTTGADTSGTNKNQ
jgi:hypothetical protein